jgi:hypothetical protein
MAESDKLSKEDLRALARELDTSGNRSIEASEPEALEAPESDEASTPDVHLSQDEVEKEYLKQHPEETPKDDVKAAESSDTTDVDVKGKDAKDKERLDRNWKKMQEREAAARALMDEAVREKAELAKQRREEIVKRKDHDLMEEREVLDNGERGYSVRQYVNAAKQLKEEGNVELAIEAEQKARALYTDAFTKIWRANLDKLAEENPDLTDSNKPISKKCNEILNALPLLKTLPDGCNYAYRIAQGDTSKSMISELKAENAKLKKEVDSLHRATRLTGAGPAHYSGGEKKMEDMDKKERRSYLRYLAEQADMGL